jgi:hypothetical protein
MSYKKKKHSTLSLPYFSCSAMNTLLLLPSGRRSTSIACLHSQLIRKKGKKARAGSVYVLCMAAGCMCMVLLTSATCDTGTPHTAPRGESAGVWTVECRCSRIGSP